MPKPFSNYLNTVIAFFATLVFVLTSVSIAGASSTSSSSATPCTSKNLKTDVQISQCLSRAIDKLHAQMSSAVLIESNYLGATSQAQNVRLEETAQNSFLKYVRDECTAQTNPYATGTIAPIVYGECALALDKQRLALLRKEIAYFKNGGEAGNASSMVRHRNMER